MLTSGLAEAYFRNNKDHIAKTMAFSETSTGCIINIPNIPLTKMFKMKIWTAPLLLSLLFNPALAASAATTISAPLNNNAVNLTTSDGVALTANIAGSGMPCLFVHGGPGSGSEVVERLAGKSLEAHFRMIWLDQRGSGRSASDPKKDYTLDRVVLDLEELRIRLTIDKWVLMAHSFGGIIATNYAKKIP